MIGVNIYATYSVDSFDLKRQRQELRTILLLPSRHQGIRTLFESGVGAQQNLTPKDIRQSNRGPRAK